MNKFILLLSVLTSITGYLNATESKLENGQIVFAVAKVGNTLCWTQKEKNDAITAYDTFKTTSPYIVQDLTPSTFELAIATSGLKFGNYSEFVDAVNVKGFVIDKIDDLPPSQAKKLKPSTDYIKSEDAKKP